MIGLSPVDLQQHTEKVESFFASIEESILKRDEFFEQCVKEMRANNTIIARALDANRNRTFSQSKVTNRTRFFI